MMTFKKKKKKKTLDEIKNIDNSRRVTMTLKVFQKMKAFDTQGHLLPRQ